MAQGLDDAEQEILNVLRQSDEGLGFSEIVESVKKCMVSSSPKISRRLKHLVDLGEVRREITEDWPPRTLYSIYGPPLLKTPPRGRYEGSSGRPFRSLDFEVTDEPSWLSGILELDVEEVLGTFDTVRDGEDFAVRGRYTFCSEQARLDDGSSKEVSRTLEALRGHETCDPAAIVLTGHSFRGRGGGFGLYPGSRPFETTVKVRGLVRGEGKTLTLKLIDVRNQEEITTIKELTLS